MSTLLQVLLTFVGVMFVLALAAQSVQELLKAAFTIKGTTLLRAIEGLVRESVRSEGQWSIDAEAILAELKRRLQALGQGGFRKKALRLDTLPGPKLKELLADIDPGLVPGLPVERPVATAVMAKIAAKAEQWYDLAVSPVDDRYRRRMRGLALVASAIVVIPLNAGAGRIYKASRTDTAFQHRVADAVAKYDSMTKTAQASVKPDSSGAARSDSTAARSDSTQAADTTRRDSTQRVVRRPSQAAERAALADLLAEGSGLLRFGPPTWKEAQSIDWWFSILVSVIFVSLGAPFWHDLLESIFGLKNRLRGPSVPEAKEAERESMPGAEVRP